MNGSTPSTSPPTEGTYRAEPNESTSRFETKQQRDHNRSTRVYAPSCAALGGFPKYGETDQSMSTAHSRERGGASAWWSKRLYADPERADQVRKIIRINQTYWEKLIDRIVYPELDLRIDQHPQCAHQGVSAIPPIQPRLRADERKGAPAPVPPRHGVPG